MIQTVSYTKTISTDMRSLDEQIKEAIVGIVTEHYYIWGNGVTRSFIRDAIVITYGHMFNPTPNHPDIFALLNEVEKECKIIKIKHGYYPASLALFWKIKIDK